ncbi:hypothetical protein Syun_004854 [Stephania yunnanensis]|uniref:MRN complex-interacting protein N-terminal domain-containing protein n=1 Tax=Stephania yunnanensis TaxID=152371 RepID=A0AAP0L593_9MAGN
MASIVFVALQCCQCSTMQVKQKKKSTNKWSCVICNQKQSVRKIYAQGFQAKDVRKFVQNFNTSRQSLDEALDSAEPEEAEIVQDPSTKNDSFDFRKRRSDWSEYLESDEDKLENQFGRGDQEEEPRVETGCTNVSTTASFELNSRRRYRFVSGYHCWYEHGENGDEDPQNFYQMDNHIDDADVGGDDPTTYREMLHSVAGPSFNWNHKIDCCEDQCRGRNTKKRPCKKMYYFPLGPRLQRSNASESTTKHMRWHGDHFSLEDVMQHCFDSIAWRHFNDGNRILHGP